MRFLLHQLIMGLFAPWLGGFLICLTAYTNNGEIYDFESGLLYIGTSLIAPILFGMMFLFIPFIAVGLLSYLAFWAVDQRIGINLVMSQLIVFFFGGTFAFSISGIAFELKVTNSQLIILTSFSSMMIGFFIHQVWKAKNSNKSVVRNYEPRSGS